MPAVGEALTLQVELMSTWPSSSGISLRTHCSKTLPIDAGPSIWIFLALQPAFSSHALTRTHTTVSPAHTIKGSGSTSTTCLLSTATMAVTLAPPSCVHRFPGVFVGAPHFGVCQFGFGFAQPSLVVLCAT